MNEASKVKIILGIDPGTNVMGYGLIRVEGSELTLIEFSDISLKKYDDHYLKLKYIFSGLTEIIEKYNPDEIIHVCKLTNGKCFLSVTNLNNEYVDTDNDSNIVWESMIVSYSKNDVILHDTIRWKTMTNGNNVTKCDFNNNEWGWFPYYINSGTARTSIELPYDWSYVPQK